MTVFSHVALSVSSLERSAAFYSRGLSCVPGREYQAAGRTVSSLMTIPASGFRGLLLRAGAGFIELLEYRDPAAGDGGVREPRAVGYAHVGLVVPDVAIAVKSVLHEGGTACRDLAYSFGDASATVIAFVRDPDGNTIELIAHPDGEEAASHATFLGARDIGWPPNPGSENGFERGNVEAAGLNRVSKLT